MTKKGRGANKNPTGRFETVQVFTEESEEQRDRQTEFFIDHSRTILSTNQSPDVGFDVSLNPYRGCEHGCIYCYARPTHEYLGYSWGLDFETSNSRGTAQADEGKKSGLQRIIKF